MTKLAYDFVIPHDVANDMIYRNAIRRNVCSVCLDQKDDGSCGVRRVCSIQEYLPVVVEVASRVQSSKMDDYIDALNTNLDRKLEDLQRSGEPGDSALPTYLSLVLDAIDEVKGSRI